MALDYSSIPMIDDIVESLASELQAYGEEVSANLLTAKTVGAYRAVMSARHYRGFTDEAIVADMENYWSQVRDIALYDYNQVGAEYQESHSENTVSRKWVDRKTLFKGVVPIAVV